MTKFCISALRLSTMALLLAATLLSFGQRPGDLVISPTRVLLDEHGKSSDLTLLNRGLRPVRYRLSLVDMDMSEEGILHRVDGNSPVSATNILRLSPREIVLAPGVSQRIRIAVFFQPDQKDGELRSHLVFEPITANARNQTLNSESGPQLRISFEFRSVVSIPVLVRHGRLGAATTLSEASLTHESGTWTAKVKLNRSGNRSVRGNLTATFVSLDGARRVELGQIAGLAVYFPNTDRTIDLKLEKDLSTLGKGRVEIQFSELDKSRGSAEAKAEIAAPG